MSEEIKQLPKSQVELTLTISATKLAEAYETEYNKQAKEVEIKGFRKGKAPRNLVEATLSREKLTQDALNELLFDSYREAVITHKITPIAYPEIKVEKFEEGKDVTVKATVAVRPKAIVKDHKKIKVAKKAAKKVEEKEVKELIDASFKSWQEKEKEKNQTKVETATTLSQAAQNANVETNPVADNFMDISKLGQDTFEEFLKANQVTTQTELEEKVMKLLTEQRESQALTEWEKAILDELMSQTEVDLPDVLIEQELNGMLESLEAQFKPLGLGLEDYLKHQKKTREDLEKEWREQAEKNVKLEFGLAAVAEAEAIMITEEDLEKVIQAVEDEKVRQELAKDNQKVYIKYSLQREKTIEKLKEYAEK